MRYVRAGQGPPLVLVHGFASSIYTWSEMLPALAAQHDVIALDFPGFGGSDTPPDADGRRPRARGAGGDGRPRRSAPTTWSGHSLGGAIAAVTAAAQPERVRRLVLIDAAGFNLAAADRPGRRAGAGDGAAGGLRALPLRAARRRRWACARSSTTTAW